MNEEILQQIAAIEEQVAKLKELVLSGSTATTLQHPSKAPEHSPVFSPEQLLVLLFEAVIQRNNSIQSSTEETFVDAINDPSLQTALHPILHSSITESDRTMSSFFRYHWKTFEGRFADYLRSAEDPTSFDIARSQSNHRAELSEIRLYLTAQHRSPTPIVFKQDPDSNRNWKISTLGL